MGIDPGFRTGCKVAVVDGTGKFLASATIYPTPPRNDIDRRHRDTPGLDRQVRRPADCDRQRHRSRENGCFVSGVLRPERIDR